MFKGIGVAAADRFLDRMLPILRAVLVEVGPVELLKVVCTPDNFRALGEGVGYGAVRAMTEKQE